MQNQRRTKVENKLDFSVRNKHNFREEQNLGRNWNQHFPGFKQFLSRFNLAFFGVDL